MNKTNPNNQVALAEGYFVVYRKAAVGWFPAEPEAVKFTRDEDGRWYGHMEEAVAYYPALLPSLSELRETYYTQNIA